MARSRIRWLAVLASVFVVTQAQIGWAENPQKAALGLAGLHAEKPGVFSAYIHFNRFVQKLAQPRMNQHIIERIMMVRLLIRLLFLFGG